jgi:hypothetical protein
MPFALQDSRPVHVSRMEVQCIIAHVSRMEVPYITCNIDMMFSVSTLFYCIEELNSKMSWIKYYLSK